jgi:hypothetical protein
VLTNLLDLPYADILAHWLSGTSVSISDSAIRSYALHDDWLGYVYTQRPFLISFDDTFIRRCSLSRSIPPIPFVVYLVRDLASLMTENFPCMYYYWAPCRLHKKDQWK